LLCKENRPSYHQKFIFLSFFQSSVSPKNGKY
jgi:hypothetical protein